MEEAGAEFVKQATQYRKNNANVEELYHKYWQFLQDGYFSDEKAGKSTGLRVLRHEWANQVNLTIQYLIYMSKRKPGGVDIDGLSRCVSMTNKLFEIHRLLYLDSDPNSDIVGRVDIKKTFNMALDMAKKSAGKRQITVENAELLNELGVDFDQFGNYTIFSELLSNAIKYSPENSEVKATFSKEKVENLYSDGRPSGRFYNEYSFTVEDKGIGIAPQEQEDVLKPGKRGSNTGGIQGTGQGLHDVCQAAHKQKVEITSPLYPDEPKYKGTRIKAALNK